MFDICLLVHIHPTHCGRRKISLSNHVHKPERSFSKQCNMECSDWVPMCLRYAVEVKQACQVGTSLLPDSYLQISRTGFPISAHILHTNKQKPGGDEYPAYCFGRPRPPPPAIWFLLLTSSVFVLTRKRRITYLAPSSSC